MFVCFCYCFRFVLFVCCGFAGFILFVFVLFVCFVSFCFFVVVVVVVLFSFVLHISPDITFCG